MIKGKTFCMFANKKRLLICLLITAAVLAAGIAIAWYTPVSIPSGFAGKMAVYTRNKPNAEITVAVIREGSTEINAYGHDGIRIPVQDRYYEIGDITATFTGAIAARAAAEGKLSPNERISELLPLPRAVYSPSVFELLTHSSAYSSYSPDLNGSKTAKRNPYTGIDANRLVAEMNEFKLTYKPPYLYSYSRFGAAVTGAFLSQVYDVDFYSILTIFAREELGLKHTFVALDNSVKNGWIWDDGDAYIASLALSSTISDMAAYARLYLGNGPEYLSLATDPAYEINADADIGYFWNLTDSNRIIYHTGETGHYAAAIVIDRESRMAVVVLSNYRNDRYGNVYDMARALLEENR